MKLFRKRGSTSNIIVVFLPDSSSTTGAGKTGLTSSSAGLNISVRRELSSAVTTYSAAGSTTETITTLGTFATPTSTKCRFKEVDSTNQPGFYEIQFADAVFDASDASRYITGMITATGISPTPLEIQLVAIDVQDAVRMGMTALPNANASASGGLLTFGSSSGQINPSSGKVPATLANTDVTGNVACDVQTIKTQSVTCSAGVTVGAFVGNGTAAISVDASGRLDLSKLAGSATPVTNLGTVFNTDFATVYDSTNKAFLAKLGNFAMGGSSLALTVGAFAATTVTVTGTTSLAAVTASATVTLNALTVSNATTLSGAVSLGSTLSVAGTTTLTGAVSATNASNDIRGIDVKALGGDSTALTNLKSEFNGTGYAFVTDSGTAQAGTSSTITLKSGSSGTDDYYDHLMIRITGGAGSGQVRVINGYVGSTKVATVSPAWSVSPDGTSTYLILSAAEVHVKEVHSGAITASSFASGALDAAWDTSLSAHLTAGSTGAALNASGSAGDPWTTDLSTYSSGQAGYVIYHNLDAQVSSRSSLDAAGVRSAIGLSTNNLDTQLGTLATASALSSLTTTVGAAGAGLTAIPKTGYKLASDGLDSVLIESGITAGSSLTDDAGTQLTAINARQALSLVVSSAAAGVLAGAASTSITIKPAGLPSGNTRITATVDADGNRSALTLKVPT